MEDLVSFTHVFQLLVLSGLLSTAFGDPQTTTESHRKLSCKRGVLLSSNRTLAPLRRVTASHNFSTTPATYVYNFGYGEREYIRTWCTADADFYGSPYVEMELTLPVLITQILFSGMTSTTGIAYVTNLTLEYSSPDNKTVLNYYTTETGSIKYFIAHHLNALVQLEQPLQTERIRLRPVEWFDSHGLSFEYICLGVGLYGCLATEAITVAMASVTTGEQPSTQSPLSTMNDDSSETTAQIIATNVVRDNQALAIVLPIALLSIAINVLLVGVGAYICVFLKRKKETNGEERSYNHGKLEWSSKSIESAAPMHNNTPSKGFDGSSRLSASGSLDKMVENPIYGSSPLPQSKNTSINRDAFIYTYEPIEHDTHTTNEEEGEEWSDNLAYGRVGSNEDEIDEHQPSQCGNVFELQRNDSYDPVPSISAQEEWTDNLAYGKVDSQDEVADHQFQHETVFELQGNKSYNSVPSISAQDEGEYSYAAFSVESPAQLD